MQLNFMQLQGLLIWILIATVTILYPLFLTGMNLYNCFSKKPKREIMYATITILFGFCLYYSFHLIVFDTVGDWYEAVSTLTYHNTISSEFDWLKWFLIIAGMIGYFVLLFAKGDKTPPLITVLAIVFLMLLNIFQIFYAIQIWKNMDSITYLLYLYQFNVLLLSARVIYLRMKEELLRMQSKKEELEMHQNIQWFYERVHSLSQYSMLIFVLFFFVVAILEIVLVFMGQGLDAPIKMFTDTADWTFSKQTPPPPIQYDGHYLCTVAAGGHEKIVKPLRFGRRRGEQIVVNRQLCIANAFEEVIQERFPSFHKAIRAFYDRYGYPVSKHITTPLRADLIYFIMKPLEWMFLLFLYMVDVKPEKRIGRQYRL